MPRKKNTGKHISHAELVAKGRISHKSKIISPVRTCWELFASMKKELGDKLTRKLAIDSALKKGVAFYTARTQWQEWRQAGDRDRANHERLYGTQHGHHKK